MNFYKIYYKKGSKKIKDLIIKQPVVISSIEIHKN